MNNVAQKDLSLVLEQLASDLDIPLSKYDEAKQHYDAVGAWLSECPDLDKYDPVIFSQGSFRLGTAIHPQNCGDYDVDAVCLLRHATLFTFAHQKDLKAIVGRRLQNHKTYKAMLKPPGGGRRCWTLKYADGSKFHLDVLPAIPDDAAHKQRLIQHGVDPSHARHAICITDSATWDHDIEWPRSNPEGYAEWFKTRMATTFQKHRLIQAQVMKAEVVDVPDYKVRTPLQRMVQLLKRHRDLMFQNDDDKPISIIITTLAAHAYQNEEDLMETLYQGIPRMRAEIKKINGKFWVPNPVNPLENFADKWEDHPRKMLNFFRWLDALEQLHIDLLHSRSYEDVSVKLQAAYGKDAATKAVQKSFGSPPLTQGPSLSDLVEKTKSVSSAVARRAPQAIRQFFNLPHREALRWPDISQYTVTIRGEMQYGNGPYTEFYSDGTALPKYASLKFTAYPNVPQPYDVKWQVVNTGTQAANSRGLRGNIFDNPLVRMEGTEYTGSHCIECFIIKNGVCVARSREFVVNVE
ncbi:nucleotidyltransferase [Vampirovibrio sp.]|uniref:nucleotidyltransferase n=1 Tax=Vampirovibrio sp. TaxID=2717857 RepID=UPI0035945990